MLPGIAGLIQAAEAMKLILGKGKTLAGRLLFFDAMDMSFSEIPFVKNPHCELCGDNPTVTELIDYEAFCTVPSLNTEDQTPEKDFPDDEFMIDPVELKALLDAGQPAVLLDVRKAHEMEICGIEGARLLPTDSADDFEPYITDLNPSDPFYLFCYKGGKSMTILKMLHERGFENLKNLRGGIQAWAQTVDPTMPQY